MKIEAKRPEAWPGGVQLLVDGRVYWVHTSQRTLELTVLQLIRDLGSGVSSFGSVRAKYYRAELLWFIENQS